jgi:hypothetical protein
VTKQVIGPTLIQLTDDDDGQGARFVQPAAATDDPAAIAVAARHALRGGVIAFELNLSICL